MLETVFTAIFEIAFVGTGRLLLAPFGWKEPGDSPAS